MTLENGRWAELTFPQQMANIGSETSRVLKALEAGKNNRAEGAFARAQELIDLTIKYGRADTPLQRSALWEELCRFRELFCAAYLSRDLTELVSLNKYLDQFAQIRKSDYRSKKRISFPDCTGRTFPDLLSALC